MRNWNTDGSIEADSRYPAWFKWLWVSEAPDWLIGVAWWWMQR
ncbi:MAG: hypothetical protein ACRD1F_09540 [Terriglobales bacterium]